MSLSNKINQIEAIVDKLKIENNLFKKEIILLKITNNYLKDKITFIESKLQFYEQKDFKRRLNEYKNNKIKKSAKEVKNKEFKRKIDESNIIFSKFKLNSNNSTKYKEEMLKERKNMNIEHTERIVMVNEIEKSIENHTKLIDEINIKKLVKLKESIRIQHSKTWKKKRTTQSLRKSKISN
jgi:hypothetical protein